MKYITRTVWILSLVSFFTDTASEMLYPVMPVFLESIGFSVVLIGILEGIAEATAGLSKGYFGNLSDRSGKRAPFIQLGYSISAVSKPLMAFFTFPLWIFFARTLDRTGKGIRTGARDALLSAEATPETKGKVFGFHRSADTFGAVLGPSLALAYLFYRPDDYQTLFILAFLPGLAASLATLLIKDKSKTSPRPGKPVALLGFLKYWKQSPPAYRQVVAGFLIFAVFNSSDMLLLLKVKQSGYSDTWVIGLYIFYNLVYALTSFPLGILADKLGLKTIFVSGLALFAIVYCGMALTSGFQAYLVLFFLYGVYAAATEGVSKAWISNITDKRDTATAIGSFAGFQSIAALIASSLTGFVWAIFGVKTAFLISSLMAAIVVIYFLIVIRKS